MSVVVVTPPPPIVSLALAKRHLRVEADNTDDDDIIPVYIAAAQAAIDGPGGWLGRCVGLQTLELRLDGFVQPIWGWGYDTSGLFWGGSPGLDTWGAGWPTGRVDLPFPPLVAVTSVTYEDANGVTQTLPSADYLATDEGLDAAFGQTLPNGRWEANAVRIQYQAGYATPPAPIVAAVMMMVGGLYANREDVVIADSRVTQVENAAAAALLAPYRVWS